MKMKVKMKAKCKKILALLDNVKKTRRDIKDLLGRDALSQELDILQSLVISNKTGGRWVVHDALKKLSQGYTIKDLAKEYKVNPNHLYICIRRAKEKGLK